VASWRGRDRVVGLLDGAGGWLDTLRCFTKMFHGKGVSCDRNG